MKVYKEITDIWDLNLWSGAIETRKRIVDQGKEDIFMDILECRFIDGASECEINDYMWFQSAEIYKILGIKDEEDFDIALAEEDYIFDETTGNISIDKGVFDDFEKDSTIDIKFTDEESEPIYTYKMIREDKYYIYCESMETI